MVTEQKTENEIIAEFEGAILITYPVLQPRWRMYNDDKTIKWDRQVSQLKYDTSWDWLMPVVEKIIAMDYLFHFWPEEVSLFNQNTEHYIVIKERPTNIQSVYKAVVEFVKFYNSQKQ